MTPRLDALSLLIVDDVQYTRTLVRSLFLAFGITQVRDCENAEQALKLMHQAPAEIVLTDLVMAPQDGLELTRRLRDSASPAPMVPIIMMSASGGKSQVEAARDAGVNEFIIKPITARALFDRLVAVIDSPRAFVQSANFKGPDRRRRKSTMYSGKLRRASDMQKYNASNSVEV